MTYAVTKHTIVKKRHALKGVLQVMLLVIATPAAALAMVCLLLYFLFLWLKSFFEKNKPADDHYHLELVLLKNDRVTITLTEDEADTELMQANELWMAQVYDEETCLYRADTVPRIAAIHGRICCFYLKTVPEGVLLQVLCPSPETGQPLHTQLVLLNFEQMGVTVVDETGPYFLYNDDDATLIRGFNQKASVELRLQQQ